MKAKFLLVLFISFMFSCKSAKQKRCEELSNREPLNIKSYEELISYEKNETREISMIVLDGKVTNEKILKNMISNNNIIEVQSVISTDGTTLDGNPKRVLIVVTNQCKKENIN